MYFSFILQKGENTLQFIKIFSIILVCLYLIVLFVFAKKSGGFFKTLLLSALSGVLAMAVVNVLSGVTGVDLPVNPYTVLSSATLGIPGVFGLLTLRLFF